MCLSGQTQCGSIRSRVSYFSNESDWAAIVFANSSYPYQGARSQSSPLCRLAPQKLFNPPAENKYIKVFREVSARSARLPWLCHIQEEPLGCGWANVERVCRLPYKHGAAAALARPPPDSHVHPRRRALARATAQQVGLIDPAVVNLLGRGGPARDDGSWQFRPGKNGRRFMLTCRKKRSPPTFVRQAAVFIC